MKQAQMYLRDIVMSRATILPNMVIDVDSIPELFDHRLEIEKMNIRSFTFIRYPYLFGKNSPLRNVWFEKNILPDVTNSFLYVLENKLSEPYENCNDLDKRIMPQEWELFVLDTSFPIEFYVGHIHGHPYSVAIV
ncbi:MAG: hypothetical protein J5507_01710 [Clostridia bacterium]|nr:hypothetical protein [Clostridia bacterium]